MLDLLEKNEADIVAGAVSYTPERAQKYDLTTGHLEYSFTLLINKKYENLTNFSDLKGVRIALKESSISEQMSADIWGNNNEIVRETTTYAGVRGVLSGNTEAMMGSSVMMQYYAKQNPDKDITVIYDKNLPKNYYTFAVKKGNTELLNILNEGLDKVKADGTYDSIYKKYWK